MNISHRYVPYVYKFYHLDRWANDMLFRRNYIKQIDDRSESVYYVVQSWYQAKPVSQQRAISVAPTAQVRFFVAPFTRGCRSSDTRPTDLAMTRSSFCGWRTCASWKHGERVSSWERFYDAWNCWIHAFWTSVSVRWTTTAMDCGRAHVLQAALPPNSASTFSNRMNVFLMKIFSLWNTGDNRLHMSLHNVVHYSAH